MRFQPLDIIFIIWTIFCLGMTAVVIIGQYSGDHTVFLAMWVISIAVYWFMRD